MSGSTSRWWGGTKKARISKAQASKRAATIPMPIHRVFPDSSAQPAREDTTILAASASPSSVVATTTPMPVDTVVPAAASPPTPFLETMAPVLESAESPGPVVAPAHQTLVESATPSAMVPATASPPPLRCPGGQHFVPASLLFPLTQEEVGSDGSQGLTTMCVLGGFYHRFRTTPESFY